MWTFFVFTICEFHIPPKNRKFNIMLNFLWEQEKGIHSLILYLSGNVCTLMLVSTCSYSCHHKYSLARELLLGRDWFSQMSNLMINMWFSYYNEQLLVDLCWIMLMRKIGYLPIFDIMAYHGAFNLYNYNYIY